MHSSSTLDITTQRTGRASAGVGLRVIHQLAHTSVLARVYTRETIIVAIRVEALDSGNWVYAAIEFFTSAQREGVSKTIGDHLAVAVSIAILLSTDVIGEVASWSVIAFVTIAVVSVRGFEAHCMTAAGVISTDSC